MDLKNDSLPLMEGIINEKVVHSIQGLGIPPTIWRLKDALNVGFDI